MTTRERVMAALAGCEVNRVPLGVWMHNFASENSAHGLAAHADPSDTTSVPGVEIFEPYIVMDFGGYALGITLNQRVQGAAGI